MKHTHPASNSIIEELMEEIMSGEIQKDTLPNSALEFSEERQALYFSNLRKNLQSDVAWLVMSHNHQTIDNMLNEWGVLQA